MQNLVTKNITDSLPEELCLVDFYAEWCGPCKVVTPLLLDLEHSENVPVFGVDIDKNKEVAQEFGIRNIPTVVLFKNKQPVQAIVGARPKKEYEEAVKAHSSTAKEEEAEEHDSPAVE